MPYELLKELPEPEGILGSAGRQIVRSGVNFISSAASVYPEILTTARNLLSPTTFSKEFSQLPRERQEELIQNPAIRSQLERPLGIPRSEDIKNFIGKALPEGYLKPQNESEKFSDDIFSDLGTYLSPAGITGFNTTLPTLAKVGSAVAGSVLGNISSRVAKNLGFKETGQFLAKIGGFVIGSTVKPFRLRNIDKQIYKNAENLLSPTAEISSKNVSNDFNKVIGLNKQGKLPFTSDLKYFSDKLFKPLSKSLKKEGAEAVRDFKVKDAIDLKKDINKVLFSSPTKVQKKYLEPLRDSLNESIKEYGTKHNPEFLKNWVAAEDLYGSLQKVNRVTTFIEKHVTAEKLIHPLTPIVLGLSHFYAPAVLQGALGALGAAKAFGGVLKSGELFFRSPAIRDIYANVFKDAAKENIKLINKDALKLDQALLKEFPLNNQGNKSGKYELLK